MSKETKNDKTKRYGVKNYYLVYGSTYDGEYVNYGLDVNGFKTLENTIDANLYRITSFSPKIFNTKKQIEKYPLPVLDMLTTSYDNADDLLNNLDVNPLAKEKVNKSLVGYFRENYYHSIPAVYNDPTLYNIAYNSYSGHFYRDGYKNTAPVINLRNDSTNKVYESLVNSLLSDKDFAVYLKNYGRGDRFNENDDLFLNQADLYHRYKDSYSVYQSTAVKMEQDAYSKNLRDQLISYKNFRAAYLARNAYYGLDKKQEFKNEEKAKVKQKTWDYNTKKNKHVNPKQRSFFDDDYNINNK